jgi:hypothetical protein
MYVQAKGRGYKGLRAHELFTEVPVAMHKYMTLTFMA